jgi:hypothetical protein
MGLISTLKKNDSLAFDLIQNASGLEHYKDDFISIDIDNIESESKTHYYEGVELNIYSGDDIKNFEKVALDKAAWEFNLPIIKMHMQGVNAKQFENLISTIGINLKEFSLDFSDFQKLNTKLFSKYCPNVKKLSLKGDSWDEDKPIVLELNEIEKLDLDFLKIEIPGEKKVFDFSSARIKEIELDDIDASKTQFPSNIEKLNVRLNCDKVNWNNLSSIKEMILGFCPESTISNLNFLGAFKTLNKLELNLSGEPNQFQINLPTDLQELEFNTGGVEVDLSFLSNAKNLKYLKLQTDVHNNGKGFKKLDVLGKLEGLEKLILDENAMGANNYKSDFKPKNLSTLINLKYLVLDGMMNLKDLTDLKGLDRLEYLKIRNSKISSIKGVSEMTNLKKFELFDCHSIDDLTPLINASLDSFHFNISLLWGTEVKLQKEHIQQLEKVNIKQIEIYIEDRKFPKKDYTALSKKYQLEPDGCCLWLTLKS